jgi:hypothetical protein
MKRQFPRIERRALWGLAAALTTLGAACSPNNSVKSGAPVLFEMDILESGGITSIGPTTLNCVSADGGAPSDASVSTDAGTPADAGAAASVGVKDGGACDPTADVLCRQASDWCRCAGTDPANPTTGAWNCGPFSPTSSVIFVFDRVIDTTPLDPAGSTTTATLTATPMPSVALGTSTDYTPNGSTTGLVFGGTGFDGPRLTVSGTPELPAGAAVTITLDKNNVRAKDGHTSFVGMGFLADGSITFKTAPFSVAFTVPQAPPSDAGADAGPAPMLVAPDGTPVMATFNNPVCVVLASGACDTTTLATHVQVTAGGTPFAVDVTSTDGITLNIAPHMAAPADGGADAGAPATWPPSSTISVTIDGTTADLDGDTLVTAQTAPSFTTGAM